MKIRKHKNNRTFRITFQTCHVGRKLRMTPKEDVLAVGSDEGSVLRAFLFGRDASNTLTSIRPV